MGPTLDPVPLGIAIPVYPIKGYSITVPITTVMLSRAALFRARRKPCGDLLPPPLHPEHTIESAGPGDTRAG